MKDVIGSTVADRLSRSLQSRHVTMIAIGGIIGAGLFVGSSTSIATVGPAVIVSYLLAGLVILVVMRMLSEMAAAHPGSSSFTDFVRLGLGEGAGMVTGWLYWYFWVVVVAIEAIAGAEILRAWLPFATWQIGVVLLAMMTATNLWSTRSYGEFEFWLSSLKVGAIIAFIVIGTVYVFGVDADRSGLNNLTDHGGFAPNGWMAMLAGVTSVIFALCGAEIATIAAAESAESERLIARLTWSVAVRILLFYVLSIALILAIVPWPDIVPGQSPFAAALAAMGVPAAAVIMNIVVLIAVLSCLNSGLYVTSRILFSLAAHGDAPTQLVRLNSRKTPVPAILVATAFGYLALAASVISPALVFSFLVNASGATMLIIYLILAVSQIRLRRQRMQHNTQPMAIQLWWFPWTSYIVIAAILAILLAMAFTPALVTQFIASFALLVVLATWVAIRGVARRNRHSQQV